MYESHTYALNLQTQFQLLMVAFSWMIMIMIECHESSMMRLLILYSMVIETIVKKKVSSSSLLLSRELEETIYLTFIEFSGVVLLRIILYCISHATDAIRIQIEYSKAILVPI